MGQYRAKPSSLRRTKGVPMKTCKICKISQPLSEYHKAKTNSDGLDHRCKSCRKEEARKGRLNNYFVQYTRGKRSECKKKGIQFDLTAEYLEGLWTGVCPVFNVELFKSSEGRGSHNSAHLDRFNPELGYVVGNVAWISGRANRIKYDASIAELKQIVDWMERVTTIPKGSTLK